MTTQSISSKREASGWSKCDRSESNASRQRNLRPGALHCTANASAIIASANYLERSGTGGHALRLAVPIGGSDGS